MFKSVTVNDFSRVEGEALPQSVIEAELDRLGGGGREGFDFKVFVLKALGCDVNDPPPVPVRVQIYNQIGASLNRLGKSATAKSLCDDLGV